MKDDKDEKAEKDADIDEVDDIDALDDIDDIDDIDDLDELDEEEVFETEIIERDFTSRRVLVIEPDEVKVVKLEKVLNEIMPGAFIAMVDDCEEAMEISHDDEFDTIVIDLQYEDFSSNTFIKMINNDPDVLLVAFNVDNVDMADFQNRFKLEPLRKIFDNDKNAKIKV